MAPFVQRGVERIRVFVPPEQWRHIPGKINPADLPSRGSTKMADITSISLVPGFLYDENDWPPDMSINDVSKNNRIVEPKKTDVCVLHNDVTSIGQSHIFSNIGKIIKMYAYNDIWKLCRITSYVIRFISNIKKWLSKSSPINGPLNLKEIIFAETQWIRNAQSVFAKNDKYSKELKVTLGIYFDADRVLKCQGRLNKSQLQDTARNPILLPKEGHLTMLLIKRAHGGIKDTLTEVRSRFWVLQGRSAVAKIIQIVYIRVIGWNRSHLSLQ